jgi:hypothetical protein
MKEFIESKESSHCIKIILYQEFLVSTCEQNPSQRIESSLATIVVLIEQLIMPVRKIPERKVAEHEVNHLKLLNVWKMF